MKRRRRPQAQPYRKGSPRTPGATLAAMLRGKTRYGTHPMDQRRLAAKRRKRRRVRY